MLDGLHVGIVIVILNQISKTVRIVKFRVHEVLLLCIADWVDSVVGLTKN